MSFITWDGSFITNPLGANDGHIVLANANVADRLVLAEFQNSEVAYQLWRDDFRKSDRRSLAGALRVAGVSYAPPRHWNLSLLATTTQAALFEQLLEQQPQHQSTVVDAWDSYSSAPINVFIQVGERYRTRFAPGWNLLQFELLEEI